jgi:hypothetical protein
MPKHVEFQIGLGDALSTGKNEGQHGTRVDAGKVKTIIYITVEVRDFEISSGFAVHAVVAEMSNKDFVTKMILLYLHD